MSSDSEREPWEGWAIVELMGHRKIVGHVSRVEIAGSAMLRIDVPSGDEGQPVTQFYSASALFSLTPVSEEIARGLSRRYAPVPVHRYELPAPDPDPEPVTSYGRPSLRDPADDHDDDFDPGHDDDDLDDLV